MTSKTPTVTPSAEERALTLKDQGPTWVHAPVIDD